MKKNSINAVLLSLCNSVGLCFTAQGLLLLRGMEQSFQWGAFGLNLCVAFPFACLIGLFVPTPLLGMAVCRRLGLRSGAAVGLVMNLCVSLVFTILMSAVMTALNVVILAGQGWPAFVAGYFGNFLPMYVISCLVSGVCMPVTQRIADRLCKEKN